MKFSPTLDIGPQVYSLLAGCASLQVFDDPPMVKPPRTNVVLRSAYNLIHFFSKRQAKFLDELRNAIYYEFPDRYPYSSNHEAFGAVIPLIVSITKGQVKFFKNISVSPEEYYNIISGHAPTKKSVLTQFRKSYDHEIVDKVRKAKWEPASTGIKTLKRTTEMSIVKFLNTHTDIQKRMGLKDHEMIKLADAWQAAFAPYELVISDRQEDWDIGYDYRVGRSCMNNGKEHMSTFLGVLPCMPYHFYQRVPGVKMAALRRGTKAVARTIVSENAQLGVVWMVRIFGQDDSKYSTLETMLTEHYRKQGKALQAGAFYVPDTDIVYKGLMSKTGKDIVMPWPYFDYPQFRCLGKFDDATETFHIKLVNSVDDVYISNHILSKPENKDFRFCPTNTAKGYLRAVDLKTFHCIACGAQSAVSPKKPPVLHVDNNQWVCGDACAHRMGYVYAMLAPAPGELIQMRLMNREDAVEDAATGKFYADEANHGRCTDHMLFREGLYCSEDEDYAGNGHSVTINGETQRCTRDAYNMIFSGAGDIPTGGLNLVTADRFTVSVLKRVTLVDVGKTIEDDSDAKAPSPTPIKEYKKVKAARKTAKEKIEAVARAYGRNPTA